jgi:hypothetical protein
MNRESFNVPMQILKNTQFSLSLGSMANTNVNHAYAKPQKQFEILIYKT